MEKPRRKKRSPLVIIISLLVILVVVALVLKSMGIIGSEQSTRVTIEEAELRTITEKVNASGNIQPVDEVKISPEVSGEIKEMFIQEGDSVRKGQLLARIRPDNLISAYERTVATLKTQKANLAQAESRLAQSKAQLIQQRQIFERQQKLYDEKVIALQDFESAKTNYQVAQSDVEAAEKSVEAAKYTIESAAATVNEAQENLNLTKIYAPMSGVISTLLVEVGESVVGTLQMAGTEMLRIANLDSMEVSVDVNENDIIRISKYDSVIIEVDAYAYQDEKFRGIVTSIANSANTSIASTDGVTEFEVKILIIKESYQHLIKPNQPSPFRPGMTASVEIITERKDGILAVPLSAVTVRKESELTQEKDKDKSDRTRDKKDEKLIEIVFVEEEGKAKIQKVLTGINGIDFIEIKSGIKLGDRVITGPYLEVSKKLKEGDLVKEKGGDEENED